jgi:hypothetical protein
LNPHDRLRSADFKSAVSADFTIRASEIRGNTFPSYRIATQEEEPARLGLRVNPCVRNYAAATLMATSFCALPTIMLAAFGRLDAVGVIRVCYRRSKRSECIRSSACCLSGILVEST